MLIEALSNDLSISLSCPLCGSSELEYRDEHAAHCGACNLLINRQTEALPYQDGGGQAPPDQNKSHWRLINARMRLRLMAPYLKGQKLLVDIGCGSGEMLQAARDYFPLQVGYDTNRPLIEHIRQVQGGTAWEAEFNSRSLPSELQAQSKVFTLSHVIEHLSAPLDLLGEIRAAMLPGDLLYVEVPLFTGQSFRSQGYGWNLWNHEHVALYSLEALDYLARRCEFGILARGTRVFARASRSGKTHLRLMRQNLVDFVLACCSRPQGTSIPDRLIGDYGYVLLERR